MFRGNDGQSAPTHMQRFFGPSSVRPPVMVSVPGCSRLARYGQHQGIYLFGHPPYCTKMLGLPMLQSMGAGSGLNPVPRSLYLPIDRTEAAPSACESGLEGARGSFAETELVKPPDRGRSFRLRK